MKKIVYTLIVFVSVFSLVVFSGCPGPGPNKFEERLNELRNNQVPWVLASGGVEKDGYDVSDQFSGFKLTIGEYTYKAQNSLATAWSASGNWEFYNDRIDLIRRDDGVLIQVSLNGSNLILSFDTSADAGGRIMDVPGNYTFNLTSE